MSTEGTANTPPGTPNGPPRTATLNAPAKFFSSETGSAGTDAVVKFGWTAYDPFALSVDVFINDVATPWCAAVDLFVQANADEKDNWHGKGDLTVKFDNSHVFVGFTNGKDKGVLVAPAAEFSPWLILLRRLQETHRELSARFVSDEIDALLQGEDA